MAETEPTEPLAGPFQTPSWLRQRPAEHDQLVSPALPQQAAPHHDVVPAADPEPAVPARASWGGRSDTGLLGGLVMVVAALLTVVGVVIAAVLRTPASLVLPAVAASALLLVRYQIARGSGGRTSLERSLLEVQTRQGPRRFDLAVPEIGVSMSQDADDPGWQLILDDHQHRPVVLTRRHLPPTEVAPIVLHYRAIADARAASRAFRPEDPA